MAKYKIMLARVCVGGTHRAEVADFQMQAALWAQADPRIDDTIHTHIARVPTPVARNELVEAARKHGIDVLVMIDDDMAVPGDFFGFAVDFLLKHQGPAAIGVPYCTAPPREDVCVFEWASGQSHTADRPWALVNVVREDAARRTGVEEVANIGTGCIAYKMGCFDKITHPYYDYSYEDEKHTKVSETEDCWAHRKMHLRGVPLYVSWDHWAAHFKTKKVMKPVVVTTGEVIDSFKREALADRHHAAREEAKKNGGPLPPPLSLPTAAQQKYAADVVRVGPRPPLEPTEGPLPHSDAVAFAESVPGWMSRDELSWLADQARAELAPGDRWVEVGCWKGRSLAAVVLSASAGSTVVAVDTWRGSPEELGEAHAEAARDPDAVFAEFSATADELRRLRPSVGLVVRREDSLSAARYGAGFGDLAPAVVFIDGAHDEASVCEDVAAWRDVLRPGGLLCGHDRGVPGVAKALQNSFAPGLVKPGPGGLWYVRKQAVYETNGKHEEAVVS